MIGNHSVSVIAEAYKKGLKLNYGRRAMVPLPN